MDFKKEKWNKEDIKEFNKYLDSIKGQIKLNSQKKFVILT